MPPTITFERAQSRFRIVHVLGSGKTRESFATREKLLGIGDMDIRHAVEVAECNPYIAYTVRPNLGTSTQRF
jgi:hypothetical protein